MITSVDVSACFISIQGRVQGVGFRPFIYRLAEEFSLRGWVRNNNEGLTVYIEGEVSEIIKFSHYLKTHAPIASSVFNISIENVEPEGATSFKILPSLNLSEEITEISPDIALCDSCLVDLMEQPHRINYPLINCTNCGPRFTIIKDIPYDRPNTTMDIFPMCELCASEYRDIMDRRFHAQPIACNDCGPGYECWREGQMTGTSIIDILDMSVREIQLGRIIAIKGVGGYHLVCDAGNDQAVKRLREGKGRDSKPFAVMFKDADTASGYVDISAVEREVLLSWQRPIVLLRKNKESSAGLVSVLNEGISTVGVVLPYMPFHYLLMERLNIPAIVLTSGNFSEHPILIDNQEAIRQFSGIADLVITHQREIFNRVDDSVVRIIAGSQRMLRRARGFVPDPIHQTSRVEGILAMGAELVNMFCLGKGSRAYLSQYIGNLKNPETQQFYNDTIFRFMQLLRIEPEMIVTDLHPEYFSTKLGHNLAQTLTSEGKRVTIERVQHHHAHIASCMAEHQLDEQVIGVAFDGTGYGSDGHIWGSEFMLADLETFQRTNHFEYLPMPGGDKAAEEPWRMAISALVMAFGKDLNETILSILSDVKPQQSEWIIKMIRNRVNTPMTCGAGRYFDAVAALLGICTQAGYEGEGPMKLEALTMEGIDDSYEIEVGPVISFIPTFRAITQEILNGYDPGLIATKFHNTVVLAIVESAMDLHKRYSIDKVVLSGGVFQNKYLVEHVVARLQRNQLRVYIHAAVPPNDGGVALGQLIVAAKRREKYVFGCTGKSD